MEKNKKSSKEYGGEKRDLLPIIMINHICDLVLLVCAKKRQINFYTSKGFIVCSSET